MDSTEIATRAPLSGTPVRALDDAWVAGVRSAPIDVQDGLCAEADACRRTRRDEDSWRALTAYRALVDRLAGTDAENLERAAWMCREDPARDQVTRRFAERALFHRGTSERYDAELSIAECDLQVGQVAAAEQRLRRLLPRIRGREDATEIQACHALAHVFTVQRRELEGLLMARRAQEIADRHPELHPVYLAHAATSLIDAYVTLGDTARLPALVASFLRLADRMTEPDASRARRFAHIAAFDTALAAKDLPRARAALDAILANVSADPKTVGHDGRGWELHQLRLALASDRLEDAHAAASAGADRLSNHPYHALAWAVLELELHLRTRGNTAVAGQANAILDLLEAQTRDNRIGTGTRIRLADQLGEVLSRHGVDAELVGRAYRAAAEAAFDRLHEIERCARELAGISASSADDVAALAEYRARFVARHGAVLEHLRTLLADSARRGALPGWARASAGGMAGVCAWCRSVRDTDGSWLPLGHFVHGGEGLEVTHGICERCAVDLVR